MNFMNILFFVAALGAYGASPDADSLGQRHIRVYLSNSPICTCTPIKCAILPGNVEDSIVYQGANGQQIKVSYSHKYPRGAKVEVQDLTTESSLLVSMMFGKVKSGRTKTLISYENKERNQQVCVNSSGPIIDGDNMGNMIIKAPRCERSETWHPKISSLWKAGPATFGTIYTDENSAEVTRYIFRRNASEGAFLRVRIPYANIYEAEFEWGTETYGKSLVVEGATANVVGRRRVFIYEAPSEASDSDTHSEASDSDTHSEASDTEIPKNTKGADDTPDKDSAYSCTIQ